MTRTPDRPRIFRTLGEAIRYQRHSGGVVKEGVPGTTAERPWGVVAPRKEHRG